MTLFIATLATETNTFSPLPTGHAGFHTSDYHRNDGSLHPPGIGNIALIEWRRMAIDAGIPVAESICSFAQPAGITLRHVYEDLRDTLLDDLKAAMPVSIVLLSMHGAMVADGYDDCEGDTLARVRDIVGPDCTVGIELDLHCHLTETMRENADLIVTFKEYPHTDGAERARELFDLARRTANREITPVIAYHECRMINMWRTPVEPMRSFVARMKALEGQDGILSVSFGHGFPWGDVEEVGAKVVVIADTDQAKAAALAQTLAAEIWAMRAQTTIRHDTIDEAIDAAAASTGTGPVVLADVSDNAGGGAPSDNTEILRRFLDRGVTGAVIGCFWDPVAVQICQEAGEGATFDLRIGGKAGIASGNPVDLRITVRKLSDTHWQTGLGGGRAEFGPSAWVHGAGIDLILVTRRQQPFNPNAFTNMGLDLADKRIVVVKSIQHFYTAFAPLAREVRYVAAPGAIPPDFEKIPYTKRTLPYWPRVDDPFEGING
jgi:microcystin degradation protein MlrC